MDWLASVADYFRPCRKPVQKRTPSILETIPSEIVLCINDFLSPADTICLSLCSHHLHDVISPTRISTTDYASRTSALTRIAADMPHVFCCLYCAKLHRTTSTPHPSRTYVPDYCNMHDSIRLRLKEEHRSDYCLQTLFCHQSGTNYNFRHWHLVAAMKHYRSRHRHAGGVNVESLAYTEVRTGVAGPPVTSLLSVDPRVCLRDGHSILVLQIQIWVLFHDRSDVATVVSKLGMASICGHEPLIPAEGPEQNRPAIWDWESGPGGSGGTIQCCRKCGVEFQLENRECAENGRALVVTKWVDLGSGLDAHDPKWKRITAFVLPRSSWCPDANPGEISGGFERASRLQGKASNPTERNRAYLVGDRYNQELSLRGGFYTSTTRLMKGFEDIQAHSFPFG